MDSVGGRDKLESSIDLEQTLYVSGGIVKYYLRKYVERTSALVVVLAPSLIEVIELPVVSACSTHLSSNEITEILPCSSFVDVSTSSAKSVIMSSATQI